MVGTEEVLARGEQRGIVGRCDAESHLPGEAGGVGREIVVEISTGAHGESFVGHSGRGWQVYAVPFRDRAVVCLCLRSHLIAEDEKIVRGETGGIERRNCGRSIDWRVICTVAAAILRGVWCGG